MQTMKEWWVYLLLAGLLFIGGLIMANLMGVNMLEDQIYTQAQQELLSYTNSRIITQAPVTTNFLLSSSGAPGLAPADEEATILPASFSVWENSVQATLRGRFEEQEGISSTLYDLDFVSDYHLQHSPTGVTTTLELIFPFPANLETLSDVQFEVDGAEPLDVQYTPQQIRWLATLEPGDAHDIRIRYQADGANSFSYGLSQNRRTNQLDVTIAVEGLAGSEVLQHSLPTTAVTPSASAGETFVWQYDNLVANRDIHLALPQQLSFAQRVAALQDNFTTLAAMAPFLVLLFLGALAVILHNEGKTLEWPGYLLIGSGFLLFYPLLTFLSAVIGGFAASLIAFALVLVILAGFLWLLTRDRKIVQWMVWLLFIFLAVISLGVLLPFRGLLWVSGGVMLVGTLMAVYARRPLQPEVIMAPSEAFIKPEAEPDVLHTEWVTSPESLAAEEQQIEEPETRAVVQATPFLAHLHCPQCGRPQAKDYIFCPGCGYDGRAIRQCPNCGHGQVVKEGERAVYCVHCGQSL